MWSSSCVNLCGNSRRIIAQIKEPVKRNLNEIYKAIPGETPAGTSEETSKKIQEISRGISGEIPRNKSWDNPQKNPEDIPGWKYPG